MKDAIAIIDKRLDSLKKELDTANQALGKAQADQISIVSAINVLTQEKGNMVNFKPELRD